MKNRFVQILIWLTVIFILTCISVGIWYLVFGIDQSTSGLKWMQFIQTVGTFLLPPILCAWLWDTQHQPFAWLHMDRGADWRTFLLAVLIMICAVPAINLMMDLNGRIVLPKSLEFIENYLRAKEDELAVLTERFLHADNAGMLIINIVLLALLPAIAEELSFRGTLQQLLGNKHVAIWVTAILFSAIHMQFYGFFARMFMGVILGYMFVWSGSLWVPIAMHFTNNAFAVIAYYFFGETAENGTNYADTIGAGTTWWLGVISLVTVIVLMTITYRGLQGYDRRTHIQ